MTIARAIRAAGKQVTVTGRPARLTRPVRMKPLADKDPPLPYDEAQEPARIERQAKEFAEVQANLKPLTEERWEEVQELRPRTPFESKIGRSHARIRTGEASSLEDIKDWATDVLVEAMMRKEETVQRSLQP